MQGCPGHNTIAAFVDGSLADADLAAIEAHIDGCDECRRHISSLIASPPSQSFVFDSPETVTDGELPTALVPGAQVGRFIVLRIIARGGMGTVARAYDPELDRRVALKLLRPELWRDAGPELRAQLRREAVVMARLAHPNVVTVFDVGTWGEQVFIAMEYVDGSTLARWQEGRPWRERLAACLAAAGGLAAAHRAGVIHRDVKPANILCDDDGRVLVGDFGLAALEGGDAAAEVAGTLGYMAPEQMEGRPVDERSDQFSFCVTAWEVLTGRRPFAGRQLDELHAAIRRGPPAVGRGLEGRVLSVLARGLAAAPDQRHDSMAALAAGLERAAAPRIRRRWFAAGAGLAAAGLGAAFLLWPASGGGGPRCGDGQDRLAATWNPERKAALAAAFPGADRFVARIDRQARDWAAAHADACRATHERGEQSAAMLDARMSCLGRQLGELDALLDAMSGPGDPVAPHVAIAAAHALPRADRCSAEAIAGRGRPATYPRDPAARQRALEVDRLLDQAAARHRLAQLDREKALLDRAVAGAAALGDPVRHARALLALGILQFHMNQVAEAKQTLQHCALLAAEGHDDETAAGAAAEMLGLVIQEERLHGDEFAMWEQTLERELARRPDDALRARLELERGLVLYDQGKLDDALAHAEKGLALAERAHGANSPKISSALRFIGAVQAARGDGAAGQVALQRAVDLVEASYGPDHPDVAAGLSLLARAVADGGDPPRAVALLERSLAIRERVFGPEHPDVAQSLGNLATALELAGDLAGARRAYERALAIEEKTLGLDSWESAPSITSLAGILAAQGDPKARPLYERAVALYRDKFPPDFADQTVALAGLGRLLRRAGHCDQAAPHLARALAIHRTHKTPPPAELVADARACRVPLPTPARAAARP